MTDTAPTTTTRLPFKDLLPTALVLLGSYGGSCAAESDLQHGQRGDVQAMRLHRT